MNTKPIAAALIASAVLAGCASPGFYPQESSRYPANYPPAAQNYPAPVQSYPVAAPAYSDSVGVVESIQVVRANAPAGGMGLGTVLGGAVGGLLGHQVGGGRGKTVATIAGAVGGAMVGNQVEQRNRPQAADAYQVAVRLDNGSIRTVAQDNVADLQIGGRVRIDNDRVVRY